MTRQHKYVDAASPSQYLVPQTPTLSSRGAMPGGGVKRSPTAKVMRTGSEQPAARPPARVRVHGHELGPLPTTLSLRVL